MRRFRWKTWLLGAACSVLLILIAYAAAEFLLFPFLLPRMSYRQRWRLDFPQSVLAQSTKAHRIPRDYIALLGDSYALGLGDEWETLDRSGREPFASAAILHRRTGRDVLTFGFGGAGNITGFVAAPQAVLSYLGATWRYRTPPPSIVLAYFYEGNDLSDNLREIDRYKARLRSLGARPGPARAAALSVLAAEEHPLAVEFPPSWRNNFFLAGFLRSAARKLVELTSTKPSPAPPSPPTHSRDVPTENKVLIGGRTKTLPGRLQGPELGLSEAQIQEALAITKDSLESMRRLFPRARVIVVYIPSTLSCYVPATAWVDVEDPFLKQSATPSRPIASRSDRIEAGVAALSQELGFEFVDTRPSLRAAARRQLVHGPFDWRHFNRYGYQAMTQPILEKLGPLPK